jgi:hypothetical protein
MSETSMLVSLMQYVLPREIVACFSLVDIEEKPFKDTSVLHLHLDENNVIPVEYQDIALFPNGFYPASTIKDFPLRDRKVVLHVRRRRWIDKSGKSYSRRWELTAEGTRYSKEFAFFLKEAFGYQSHPHSIP